MPLTILDSSKLRRVRNSSVVPGPAQVTMEPTGRAYLTTVYTDVDGVTIHLYAESHPKPQIPGPVAAAVEAFNAQPLTQWRRLVIETLDTETELLAADRVQLDEREREIEKVRELLLG